MTTSIPPIKNRLRGTIGALLFSVVIGLLMSGQLLAQDDYTGKKVLVINSYHEGYAWSDGVEAGLQTGFEDTEVELQIVRMDTKRNTEEAFREAAALEAKAEIDALQPDVIIAVDDNAQSYLVVPYLMDTDYPIIFAGVNWDASIYGYPTDNVTGMVEVELVEELVTHLQSYAEGDRVGYVTVNSVTERKVADEYNERFFDGQLQVYSVETYEEFTAAFLQAQEEVDMVFVGNNAGIDEWDDAEAAAFFADHTRVPTGSINSWMAPCAMLTLAKIPEEQGEWSAQAALQILDGTAVVDIPMVENKDGKLILNLDIAEQMDVAFAPSLLRNAEIYGP